MGKVQSGGKCSRLIFGTFAKIFSQFFSNIIVDWLFLYMISSFGTSKSNSLDAIGTGSQGLEISFYRRFDSPCTTFHGSWTGGPKLILWTDLESSESVRHVWVKHFNHSYLTTATNERLHLPPFLRSWGKCSHAEGIGDGVSAAMLKHRTRKTRNYTYSTMNWEI